MENQKHQLIENQELATKMAHAENNVRSQALGLARSLGVSATEFFSTEQHAAINARAAEQSDAVKTTWEAEQERLKSDIHRTTNEALLGALGSKVHPMAPINVKGRILSPDWKPDDETLVDNPVIRVWGHMTEASDIFDSKVAAGENSPELASTALVFGLGHELAGVPLPRSIKEGQVEINTRPLHNQQATVTPNGSPVVIRTSANTPPEQLSGNRPFKGGEAVALYDYGAQEWSVYTLHDNGAGVNTYKAITPDDDGKITFGRQANTELNIHTFGDSFTDASRHSWTATSRSHATLQMNPNGTMTIVDHSMNGTTYQQADFARPNIKS